LAADPAILLLDEPFGALDPITRAEMQKEFRTLQKQLRKTVVFVTHDVREALLLGDRIGLLKDGRLLALVPAADFRALDHPEARAFAESCA
jgi:osmoprotectant transport system ATP-binding protein